MKYSIMHDLVDDTYWIVDRVDDRAEEIKVFESDSLHACFNWFRDRLWDLEDDFNARPNVELHDTQLWCVYWSDFDENYYICEDKGDGTLDDVCYQGTEEECEEYFCKKYIKE